MLIKKRTIKRKKAARRAFSPSGGTANAGVAPRTKMQVASLAVFVLQRIFKVAFCKFVGRQLGSVAHVGNSRG